MKIFTRFLALLVLGSSCPAGYSGDENTLRQQAIVIGVLEFSPHKREALNGVLRFIEVTKDGVAVFAYLTDKTHIISGKPGDLLHGEIGTVGTFLVMTSSEANQTATLQLLQRPRQR
jgi:hypothetical protein